MRDAWDGGEAWRVLFARDRTFQRIALETPVDGTIIRVFKNATRKETEALTVRAYSATLIVQKRMVS